MTREQAVYLMERDDGAIKVGISGTPKIRQKTLQAELGYEITLQAMIQQMVREGRELPEAPPKEIKK